MSAVDDFLKLVDPDITKKQQTAVNGVETVIGVISQLSGYLSAAKSVLQLLGVIQPDTDATLQAVQNLTSAFDAALSALDAHQTMLDVENQIGTARGMLDSLRELDEAALQNLRDGLDTARFSMLDNNAVVEALAGEAYWERVFVPQGIYTAAWVGKLAPSDVDPNSPPALEFDYRWTLPAYLEAIAIRVTIVMAIFKEFKNNPGIQQEFGSMAQILEQNFKRIRGAIVEIRPPEMPVRSLAPLDWTTWANFGAPFGAVETYSTFHAVDAWPPGELLQYAVKVEDQAWYTTFLVRHKIRTLGRWKQVYNQIGIAKVPATIAHLRQLTGAPATPIDGPTGDWSVRELSDALLGIPGSGFKLPDNKNVSLQAVLQALQTFNSQPFTSMQAAVTQ